MTVEQATAVRGFADRVPIALSPDGRLVAFTVNDPARRAAAGAASRVRYFGPTGAQGDRLAGEVLLADVRDGTTRPIAPGAGASWGPAWSPDGRRLAFYSDRDGRARLWVWERETGALRRVSDAVVRPFFGFESPRWSPDGRRLLVKLLPEGMTLADAARLLPATSDAPPPAPPPADAVTARVHAWPAPADARAGASAGAVVVDSARSFMNAALADLASVDVATGRVHRLLRRARPMAYRFSPDGTRALVTLRHPYDARGQFVWGLYALAVLDTAGRERVRLPPAAQEYGLAASWSPDGRRLAYGAGDSLRVVAGDDGREVARLGLRGGGLAREYRAPLWLGADTLAALARDTLWRLPVRGGAPLPVAGPRGWQLLDVLAPADAERLPAHDGAVLLLARERATKRVAVLRLDLHGGGGTPRFALDAAFAGDPPYSLDRSRDGRTVVFGAESADRPDELWVADGDVTRPRRLTNLNPDVARLALGRSQLVRWTTARGDTLHGALLLPPGHAPGRRHPLVVKVYGGSMLSTTVHRFGLMEGVDNLQLLATRGYAVLLPDAPLRAGTPLADLADAVLPGVDAAVALGVADPARVALMGHSYGGYSVLALLVQSDRFRAAVASGGFGDLFGHYAHLRADGSAPAIGWAERDQGRMAAHPWEARERYLANSPFFFLDRVRTPLLLVHGGADLTVPAREAEQVFVGLRRLGRPVTLVVYEGEEHHQAEWRRANVDDYWRRVFDWLATHLGGPVSSARQDQEEQGGMKI
jgi:dipeptidyl aminopeptidase/acylaminoacyl peptidase